MKFGDSVELCGGTHTSATGNIGFFKIVSESAIAAGVRRIEAVTGEAAETMVLALQDTLKAAKAMFNNAPDLKTAIQKTLADNSAFKKEIEGYIAEKTEIMAKELTSKAELIGGINVVRMDSSVDPAMVRACATILQKEVKNFGLAAAFQYDGKPNLVLMYSPDLVAKGKNAGKDIREAAKFILGGGGGQPGLATAGGKNTDGLGQALDKMVETATA